MQIAGGLSMTHDTIADSIRPFLSRAYENFAVRMSFWILAGAVAGVFVVQVLLPPE
jgi:hypothetical protein